LTIKESTAAPPAGGLFCLPRVSPWPPQPGARSARWKGANALALPAAAATQTRLYGEGGIAAGNDGRGQPRSPPTICNPCVQTSSVTRIEWNRLTANRVGAMTEDRPGRGRYGNLADLIGATNITANPAPVASIIDRLGRGRCGNLADH